MVTDIRSVSEPDSSIIMNSASTQRALERNRTAKVGIFIFASCHGERLAELLKFSELFSTQFQVTVVRNFTKPGVATDPEPFMNAIVENEAFFYQKNSLLTDELLERISHRTATIRLPYVTSMLYWPTSYFPERDEDRLLQSSAYPWGAIPMRCRLLDELVRSERSAEWIVRTYLATEIRDHVDIDTHLQSQFDYWQRVDRECEDFKVAELMMSRVFKEQMFHLPRHPSIDLFRNLAARILAVLGLADDLPAVLPDHFAGYQAPILPSVAEALGLSFFDSAKIWPVGPYAATLGDYVRLYVDACRSAPINAETPD